MPDALAQLVDVGSASKWFCAAFFAFAAGCIALAFLALRRRRPRSTRDQLACAKCKFEMPAAQVQCPQCGTRRP